VSNAATADPKTATTFPQMIRAAAAAYGDSIAVVLSGETVPDDEITFNELERQSAELARGLVARGVGKGTRVGFIYGNGPNFALMLAAISRIGAIAIPMSTLIRHNELVRVLRQSDVAGLILQRKLLGRDYVERICEALPELNERNDPDLRIGKTPFLRWIVSTGEGLPPSIRDMSWLTSAADEVSEELLEAIESEVHPADQMLEIYTSGSMALPKGVKHNHGPVLYRTHYLRRMQGQERHMQIPMTLPGFWIGGFGLQLLPALEIGGVAMCTEATKTDSRTAMGTVLSKEAYEAMEQNMARGPIMWGLGMTETLGPYAYGDELRAPGYPLCTPLDHIAEQYEVRVVDEEGKEVPIGASGEVQVRGYPVTTGLHKVERSEEYFTPDGFYRTGDQGDVVAHGDGRRINFAGRFGDMIKTASANVSPAEVELELQELEGVHSAYVFGVPDPKRGQMVVAGLVPRDGVTLDFAEIEAILRQRMSGYKVPRAYVALTREEVPMLHSNKVFRRELEKMIAAKLETS
jgi:acyl-CoA synthetase (AMP-forming)/AMP-acid ligase II